MANAAPTSAGARSAQEPIGILTIVFLMYVLSADVQPGISGMPSASHPITNYPSLLSITKKEIVERSDRRTQRSRSAGGLASG